MVRHVVLLGHDASLATTLRTLLDPDDRLAEVDGVEGWQHVRQDEIDAVVVDLPSTVRLQAVGEVRSTYGGRLILLDPADDSVSVPSEYDCLVIRRPDIEVLWNLADNGQALPSALSQVAGAGPTAGMGSTRAPHEPAAAGALPADAEEGGMPTPEGRPPSVPILPPGSEDRSDDRDSMVLQMLSAQRPVTLDSSEIDRPLSTAPLDGGDLPQSVAVEIAERLAADVVVVLLDNGEGLMEVSGGVGLTPADVRQSVEYSHDAMRELFRTSLRLIVDTSRVGRALVGIPGSHAQTLLKAMLVHDHNWFGVLIAGRNRSQSGVPAETFTGADVRSLVAIGEAATPSLHSVVLLRRLEWGLKAGNSSRPARPGPTTVAEPSGATSAPASMPSPGPSSTLPIEAAPSARSTQDARARAAQSAGPVDTRSGRTGRAAAMLLAYLIALATVDLVGSSPAISVPVAVTSHGLLALLLCVALRMVAGQGIAVLVPPLIAISVVRLVTLGALPGDVSPLTRLVVVGIPALVAVAMAARQRSPDWRMLRPHTGGWPGQLLVGLIGIPSALAVWAIAPPAVEVRGGTSTIVAATLLVLFAALPEELLYRGLLVPAAAAVVGLWGVPFASATYALAYVTGGSIATVLLAFLLGIVLGWCRWLTGSVVGVIGAHSLLNVIVYLVLPASG
jgi:membrane protease YdiL (CAAX protease family)